MKALPVGINKIKYVASLQYIRDSSITTWQTIIMRHLCIDRVPQCMPSARPPPRSLEGGLCHVAELAIEGVCFCAPSHFNKKKLPAAQPLETVRSGVRFLFSPMGSR